MRRLVVSRLGIEPSTAGRLADEARERLGPRGYAIRAACFAAAVAPPAALLPPGPRRRALLYFVGPLLHTPAALNAYGAGRDELLGEPCGGLWRGAPGARG